MSLCRGSLSHTWDNGGMYSSLTVGFYIIQPLPFLHRMTTCDFVFWESGLGVLLSCHLSFLAPISLAPPRHRLFTNPVSGRS